jgi:hypothetical protein
MQKLLPSSQSLYYAEAASAPTVAGAGHAGQGYSPSHAVIIQNLEDDFSPKDELDYVNYLKLILGREDLPTKVSPSLVELTSNKRYSPDSAVERVVIAFIPFAAAHDVHPPPRRRSTSRRVGRRSSSRGSCCRMRSSRRSSCSSLPPYLPARSHACTNSSRPTPTKARSCTSSAESSRR